MNAATEFERALATVVTREIEGVRDLVRADRLSGGASQETYRIKVATDAGEKLLAMRRAPGGMHVEAAAGHPGLEAEALLMKTARDAGVPEPEVFYVLRDSDGLGDGFIMEWLEGEALGARINRSEQFAELRPRLAFECGKIMARIHAIDVEASGLDRYLEPVSPEAFVQQTWDRYKALSTPQPMIDYAARWLLDHLPAGYTPALVHNDFRNGNFMIDEQGIVAVLDWELAHIGDPMRDLGWICVNSWRFGSDKPVGGFGEYEDLFAGYESVSGTPVDPDAVKFWEVFGSFWWSVGCLGMAEHYRNGPDKTVERPAIGRRSSECQVDCVNLLIPGPVTLLESRPRDDNLDMPRLDELVTSVRDFLRGDVMEGTEGRVNFLARVASNSLDIVLRELAVQGLKEAEHERLKAFYGSDDSLEQLRWRLVEALRDGSQSLDDEALTTLLRETVVNQIAVDQPKYTGFKNAVTAS